MKNLVRLLKLAICSLPLTVLFANCSPGFKELNLESAEFASEASCFADLTSQYQQLVKPTFNTYGCAGCHSSSGAASSTRFILNSSLSDTEQMQSLFVLMDSSNIDSSILLLKPTQGIAHTGGQLFASTSTQAANIRSFIQAAATNKFCTTAGGSAKACTSPDSYLAPQIKRLTSDQFANSLKSAFGDIFQSVTMPNFNDSKPRIGMSNDPDILRVDQVNVLSLYQAAGNISSTAIAQNSTIAACVSATSDTCFTTVINSFGQKLWRRPLASDEVTSLTGNLASIGTAGGTRFNKMDYILKSLVMSPNHLFRSEIGKATSGSDLLQLTDYEIASLLSFNLWDYPPDDQLMTLAQQGQLRDAATLQAQVRRMSTDARFRSKMGDFFVDLLKIEGVKTVAKGSSYNFTVQDREALFSSAKLTLSNVYSNPSSDFFAAFSNQTFYANNLSAKYFGENASNFSSTSSAFTAKSTERYGMLSHPAFLSSIGGEISSGIVKRGVFALEQLLCYHLGNPPANVGGVSTLPAGFDPTQVTSRVELQVTHSSQAACIGCHSTIDPAGFGFENFGATGIFRLTEKAASVPIDSSGSLTGVAEKTLSFNNSLDYFKVISESETFRQCVKKKYFKYALGQTPESQASATCEFQNFEYASKQGDESGLSMIESLVGLKSFTLRKPAGK